MWRRVNQKWSKHEILLDKLKLQMRQQRN